MTVADVGLLAGIVVLALYAYLEALARHDCERRLTELEATTRRLLQIVANRSEGPPAPRPTPGQEQ
ncbi:MAG: hypothetical protein AUI15_33790 [Actinobacteria bacterium 13_2_20CM_2_66_6]|nr:MAG: hypothetical protein AUI15_33790 [Actinobacteria bacterium 13_2_20CM_2_66_6]